ncbi:MAG: ABC-2 family transporter protein [Myxococcales bacterium]|nr:ABC-2 family transporter protein [Myxococcales bacterium]
MTRSLATAGPSLPKYIFVARLAFLQGSAEGAALLGRVIFYGVILLVFSRLWLAVLEGGSLPGVTATECLWYLAITEWVALSQPASHLDIEREVRGGDVAYRVARPISYVGARLAEGAGEVVFRFSVLVPVGVGFAYALGGGLSADASALWLSVPLALAAALLLMTFHVAIGLMAFWLDDVSPVYWVWQKLLFVLGGLMLPLQVYPSWLRAIAAWTPFSAMLHGPGTVAFGVGAEVLTETALRLAVWFALALLLLGWIYRAGLRRLEVGGG